jgi:hypothetical protein
MAAMTTATINNETDLAAFIDLLIEDLSLMSDEKVLADAAEDFGSLEGALGEIDAEIESAINSLGKDRLAEARAAFSNSAKNSARPTDATEAYHQLADFIISDPNLTKVTLAARNGRGSLDIEALSTLFDLCELRQLKQSSQLPNFGSKPKADYILKDLGVTKPEEIDVEAIAWYLGAKVRYGRLPQCEARIVGAENVAIITIDETVSPQRQRFSICHELGHWVYHRGQMLSCQTSDIELPSAHSNNLERVADRFASELLMPNYLFTPAAESLGSTSMRVIQKLSDLFQTSRTATAIRLVELNQRPLCLVNHGKNGRRWFARSQALTGNWMPSHELRSESAAFNMIFGKSTSATPPRCVNASVWFTHRDASRFQVVEESFRVAADEILTLLSFKEEKEFLRHSS